MKKNLVEATEKEKPLPFDTRLYLLDLFNYYNVDTVFSGHTHFENVPPVHRGIQQIVMTSINYLKTWISPESGFEWGPAFDNNFRGYYVVEVNGYDLPVVTKVLL